MAIQSTMPWPNQPHVLRRKHYMYVTAVPDVIFDVLIQTIAALPAIRSNSSGSRAF
jgi:hypothetical protein